MEAASRKPASFWMVLALGAVLLWLYPFAVRMLVEAGGTERTPGWSAGRGPNGRLQVVQVDADGPAAGKLLGPEVAYLVMEQLAGTTLRAEIQRTGGIAPDRAAEWFDQILAAVTTAHASGVIHRDLKPENIFLTRDARGEMLLKVLDFGLAKLQLPDVVTESGSLTESGAVMGTLSYMSPEQLSGRPVDERTDLFALGVMVVESLTGRNPFQRHDLPGIVAAILHEPVGLAGDAPEIRDLDAVLQRCLAKDRQARFSTVAEMHAALLPALRACPAFGGAGNLTGSADSTKAPLR